MESSDHSAWWALVGAVLLYMLAGSPNAVGVYSEDLKNDLHIGQEALSAITGFGFVGYLAPLGGAICDRCGIRVGVLASGLLMAAGYLAMYLSSAGILPATPLCMGLSFAATAQGMFWLLVAGAVLFTANFPMSSGVAGGIAECALGLSAGVWTEANSALPRMRGVPLLLLLSLITAAVTLVVTCMARIRPTQIVESRAFTWFRVVELVIMALLMVSSLRPVLPHWVVAAVLAVLVGALGIAPLLAETKGGEASKGSEKEDLAEMEDETMQELTFSEALMRVDFWCAVLGICIPLGIFYAFLQTVGQVVAAAMEGASAAEVQSQTEGVEAVGSVAAGLAALIGGALADAAIPHGVPRPAWFALSAVLMAAGCVALAEASLDGIYIGLFLGSLALSIATSIFPSTVYELFGKKHNGKIFGFFNFAFSIIQLLLNIFVAVPVYNAHAWADGGKTCYGSGCYRTTFLLYAALSLSTILPTAFVTRRSRLFYTRLGRLESPRRRFSSGLQAALLSPHESYLGGSH